jgi:predicted dehydrogenase
MAEPVTVVLVGVGGYGEVYLSALLDDPRSADCRIAGAVDPRPENCHRLADLEDRGVPIHSSLDEFYQTRSADLAVISSPIHLHPEHTRQALARGSHVLVEKPAAAATADVDDMIDARDRAGRFVAVGFQWSFAPSILDLKRDILAGRFGRPVRGRSLTLWPRTESYYERNDWAGRRRDPKGSWILDSPANNAMAHDLHNLLFLLGPRMDRSAEPIDVSARLWRLNDIETFDTVAARIRTAGGAELLFLAAHTVAEDESVEPRFVLDCEDATVSFPGESASITARFRDGSVVEYASPHATPQVAKLWTCIDAVTGSVHIPCGLETARPHVACIEAIEESGAIPHTFSADSIRLSDTPGGRLRWVPGLAVALERTYETGEWPDLTKQRQVPGSSYETRGDGES